MQFLALVGALAIVGAIAAAVSFSAASTALRKSRTPGSSPGRWTASEPHRSLGTPAARRRFLSTMPRRRKPAALRHDRLRELPRRAGRRLGQVSEGLQPVPADLKKMATERTASELFWVVKNGVKMTGMPSFGAAGASDQQIWTIVAFIKKLPTLSDADYKTWTAAP